VQRNKLAPKQRRPQGHWRGGPRLRAMRPRIWSRAGSPCPAGSSWSPSRRSACSTKGAAACPNGARGPPA